MDLNFIFYLKPSNLQRGLEQEYGMEKNDTPIARRLVCYENVFPCVWLDDKPACVEKCLPNLGCAENVVLDVSACLCCGLGLIAIILLGVGSAYMGDGSGASVAAVIIGGIILFVAAATMAAYFLVRAYRMFRVQHTETGIAPAAAAEPAATAARSAGDSTVEMGFESKTLEYGSGYDPTEASGSGLPATPNRVEFEGFA